MEQEKDSSEWTGRGYTLKSQEPAQDAPTGSYPPPARDGFGNGNVPAYPASVPGQQYAPPSGNPYYNQSVQRPPSGKPKIAGVMLIVVAILGFAFAGTFFFVGSMLGDLATQDDLFQDVEEKGIITGTVEYVNGTPVSGVSVSVVGKTAQATTDSSGDFTLKDVDMGTREILFEKAGHKTVRYTMFVVSGQQTEPLDIEMETGTGEVEMNDSFTTGFLTDIMAICAVAIAIISIFPLLGGIMALQGKSFGLAILGGIIGIFSIGFVLGSILSIIALIMLFMSKEDFKGQQPPQPPYNPYQQYGQPPYQPPSYGMPPQQPYQPPREPPYQPPQGGY